MLWHRDISWELKVGQFEKSAFYPLFPNPIVDTYPLNRSTLSVELFGGPTQFLHDKKRLSQHIIDNIYMYVKRIYRFMRDFINHESSLGLLDFDINQTDHLLHDA